MSDLIKESAQYANELAQAWGFDKKIEFGPGEIVTDKKEGKKRILEKAEEALESGLERANVDENVKEKFRNAFNSYKEIFEYTTRSVPAFYSLGTVVVSRSTFEPFLDNEEIISCAREYYNEKKYSGMRGKIRKIIDLLLPAPDEFPLEFSLVLIEKLLHDNTNEYLAKGDSYVGFESEIAHATIEKLLGENVDTGVHEACDICSKVYYLKNKRVPKILREYPFFNSADIKKIAERFIKIKLEEYRKLVEIVEACIEGCELPHDVSKIELNFLAHDYLMSKHHEGRKLFLALYDFCKGDVSETIEKFGEMLRSVDVSNYEQALLYAKTGEVVNISKKTPHHVYEEYEKRKIIANKIRKGHN